MKRNRRFSATSKKIARKCKRNKEHNASDWSMVFDITKCVVCLDTVSDAIMKSLPCSHVFHEICIDEWLKISDFCPICRWPSTHNSPHMGAVGTRENYEGAFNELGEWNGGLELDEWVMGSGIEVPNYESELEPHQEYELEEPHQECELEEPHREYELEEPHQEYELEESPHEYELEESHQEYELEESHQEYELEEPHYEFESEEPRDESFSVDYMDEYGSFGGNEYERDLDDFELLQPLGSGQNHQTNEEAQSNSDNTIQCGICCETVTMVKRLPCSHLFHARCINEWLRTSFRCPTCRYSTLAASTNSHIVRASTRTTEWLADVALSSLDDIFAYLFVLFGFETDDSNWRIVTILFRATEWLADTVASRICCILRYFLNFPEIIVRIWRGFIEWLALLVVALLFEAWPSNVSSITFERPRRRGCLNISPSPSASASSRQ